MVRMTVIHDTPAEFVVRVEGDLDSGSLDPLRSTLGLARGGSRRTVDLAGVRSVDGAAGRVLRELREGGVRLEGASLYIARLLERTTP